MTPEYARQLRHRLRRCLEGASGLPPTDVDAIEVLIDAGEWEVALETLCTQAYEYDVELGVSERERLEELGRELRVPVPYLLGDPGASSQGADGQ